MRKILGLLKSNTKVADSFYGAAKRIIIVINFFVPVRAKTMMFVSFSGRNFDDSPKALYQYIRKQPDFQDWKFYWGLKKPESVYIPGAVKIRFGTVRYWRLLLSAKVWVTNGGIDGGLDLALKKHIVINPWHGTPIKKVEGEENSNKVLEGYRRRKKIDRSTIRCCQSEFDLETKARVFKADKSCFLKVGLPRNDSLLTYTIQDIKEIKRKLGIPADKKVLLYMPTYREYLINSDNEIYIKPPITIDKWKTNLGDQYCLLIRAHYAVAASLGVKEDDFVKVVSSYSPLNDLYAIADILISDYSSSFIDYSILGRPVRCFAYDLREYSEKRGLYLNLEDTLPCPVHENEDELVDSLLTLNYDADSMKTKEFAEKYAAYEKGRACEMIVEELKKQSKESK